LDIEAAAAYAFPPVTGVALLVLEHNNSYIRFHAWQVFCSQNWVNSGSLQCCLVELLYCEHGNDVLIGRFFILYSRSLLFYLGLYL